MIMITVVIPFTSLIILEGNWCVFAESAMPIFLKTKYLRKKLIITYYILSDMQVFLQQVRQIGRNVIVCQACDSVFNERLVPWYHHKIRHAVIVDSKQTLLGPGHKHLSLDLIVISGLVLKFISTVVL